MLDHTAEESGRGKGAEYALVGEAFGGREMIEHSREHTTGAAGGGGDNHAARCVFLADGEGIGIDEPSAFNKALNKIIVKALG